MIVGLSDDVSQKSYVGLRHTCRGPASVSIVIKALGCEYPELPWQRANSGQPRTRRFRILLEHFGDIVIGQRCYSTHGLLTSRSYCNLDLAGRRIGVGNLLYQYSTRTSSRVYMHSRELGKISHIWCVGVP